MENASKALLIASGILIAIIIISIGIFLFTTYSKVASTYEQSIEQDEILEFNNQFTRFIGRDDIIPQEIVTLINFVKGKEYNVSIMIDGVNINISSFKETDFLKDNFDNKKYKYEEKTYDEDIGLINSISFINN